MKTVEVNVYQFDELSDEAKEKAREWYRNGSFNYEWWDFLYDDFKERAKEVGFDVTNIYFRGFWSQGDGAMFEYDYMRDKLRLEFINQLGLSAMRKDWLINNTMTSGRGKHRGLYYHEKSCDHDIYWEVDNGDLAYGTLFYSWLESFDSDFVDFVTDKYEDLCHELYKSLEKEYEYLNSDEAVDESLIVNEYEFDEDGNRFKY